MEFLRADLPHLFDDQGIDETAYDDNVAFIDPITKYDNVKGAACASVCVRDIHVCARCVPCVCVCVCVTFMYPITKYEDVNGARSAFRPLPATPCVWRYM